MIAEIGLFFLIFGWWGFLLYMIYYARKVINEINEDEF